jgi:alanyl-tRNA synthetase
MMTADELREKFLLFFEQRGHKRVPSSSLVPVGDPTLLLTSAGMVQFKPYFTGEAVPPAPRLASCQKCFRTTDIESVGNFKHLTFFEMLGNFSVGDYFKKEAIAWSWEFVLDWLKLPEAHLWITIFLDDDEAFQHWRDVGVSAERIVRCGEEDNFWGPAGDTGPCGPCSEIHYDYGPEYGCGRPDCSPVCDCERFVEIWNLVFTEYYQDAEGKRTPLPRKNIDTGMGLERTAAVLQGKRSPYDTDLFAPIVQRVSELTGHEYGSDDTTDRAMRIIAEHGRAITFLIADGVIPSNEGRGCVLRRELRRAALFGRNLGLDEPFLARIAEAVVAGMGPVYPELVANRKPVLKTIKGEEARFGETLEAGLKILHDVVEEARSCSQECISGDEVFKLADTYGFPPELTAEVAAENGLAADLDGFEREMERQRERARAAHKFVLGDRESTVDYASLSLPPTEFVGYRLLRCKAVAMAMAVDGKFHEVIDKGQKVEVVLDRTPFYAEMGGQVGDTGELTGAQGRIRVTETVTSATGLVVHLGEVTEGTVALGEELTAAVDRDRRLDIARDHTSTHLLHAALRRVLGGHARQMGSLVAPDHFRFDFSSEAPVLPEELGRIQQIVNESVRMNLPVTKREVPYTQAVAEGAIALFGEKYSDVVRVVRIGGAKRPVSFEVCGGTHVSRTGDIGFFQIVSEGSIGSGMRRIEAMTGSGAERLIKARMSVLDRVSHGLQVPAADVGEKLESVLEELDSERKRAIALERRLSKESAGSLLGQVESVDGISVLAASVAASNFDALRHMGDVLRERLDSAVIVLGAVWGGKPNFLAMVTSDLVSRGLNAGQIVKQVAGATGGGGGGRPQIGQGGGRDKDKMEQALRLVARLVREKVQ